MKARVAGLSSVIAVAIAGLLLAAAPSAMAAPANDNFAAAQTVGPALPVSVAASNVGATAQVGEPDIYSNDVISSVWFKWTAGPATAGQVVVNLCGSGFTGDEFPFEKFAVRTSFAGAAVMEMAGECSSRFLAVNGTTYYIQVDYGTDQGDFTFKMRKLAPPANDNWAARQIIGPALPVTLNTTNSDSTWEAGEPATLGGSGSSRSVWYSWTAPANGRVALDVCEDTPIVGASNKRVVVYTGNSLGTLLQYAVPDSDCEINFLATAGVNYTIAFSGYISGEMNFALKLINAPPPTNDNFASAQVVGPGLPVSLAGNNDFATAQAGEPQHTGVGAPFHSNWYSWTPATNTRVRISACSKTFDAARVGVYTGAAVAALTQVAELPGFAPHCRVTLNAVAGTTYRIAAAGGSQENAHGEYVLDIHAESLPGNDNFANAQVIGPDLPATINGTTVDATVEDDEPSTDPYGGQRNPSVWYRWTAPSDDPIIFQACSTGPETPVIATFSGTVLSELEHIDSDAGGCRDGSNGGRLAIAPVAGQSYYVLVESKNEDYDTAFTLSAIGLKEEEITPPVPAFNLKKAIAKCKKIKGTSRKAKKKRANCIKAAKKKAAIIKCKKLTSASAEAKCIKAAQKKFR